MKLTQQSSLKNMTDAERAHFFKELEDKANWVRRTVLEMAVKAHSGHISTAFSQAEMLVALYCGGILRVDPDNPKWEDRDRFIISKGQGGIGLYPILADVGFFPVSELDNFTAKDSYLGVHAEWGIPGVELLSGSLGHGLPISTGIAQVGLIDKKDWLVVCFLGDAELYEGSNWEAAFFAGHKGLKNLICIVDRNGQGTIGYTDKVIAGPNDGPRLEPLDKKFEAFGFEVRILDGHSYDEIFRVLADIRERASNKPLAIISKTKKGKGVSFMEDQRLWHYRVPAGPDLEVARRELSGASIRSSSPAERIPVHTY